MQSTKLMFLLVQLIFIILKISAHSSSSANAANSAQFEFLNNRCGDTTFYSPSAYLTNLDKALGSMSSDTKITYGYYNFSAGLKPNRVEAMALCRADVSVETCRSCVRSAIAALPSLCGDKRQAVGYAENCLLYYTNSSAFGVETSEPNYALRFNGNVTDIPHFKSSLTTLMTTLQKKASLGNSKIKFATGKTDLTPKQSLYGLVQCSPDLNSRDCVHCVQYLIDNTFSNYFVTTNKGSVFMAKGGRVLAPSCNLRYELYQFYGNVTYGAQTPAHKKLP